MNNFKSLAKLTHKRKQKINAYYDHIASFKNLPSEFQNALLLCELEDNENTRLAILRRFVDLKEEALKQELEKANFSKEKIKDIMYQIYDEVRKFYEKEHEDLIKELQSAQILDEFYTALIQSVHQIGQVINVWQSKWSKLILDENNAFLAREFKELKEALHFLKTNKLYQKDEKDQPCERSYGALMKDDKGFKFAPYAVVFKEEVLALERFFDECLANLQSKAKEKEHLAYIKYLEKLKFAFCEKDNDKVIWRWQEAELAWLEVGSSLQVAHPLEYYEDNYTHAVALEWDIRLNDESEFDAKAFIKDIKQSFKTLYESLDIKDQALFDEVQNNLDKTQLYICMPMLFYGAELNGLFSAQVVPNDEFVSAKAGKKIFAFLNFVYENTKSKPFMKLASEIFEKDFLSYGREILFFNEKLWKKVYEISTIGHEFGHIFFISKESENLMNQSGVFKNIEEFKATAGGLVSFFLHEQENLKLPVFHELIKRAVGLIAWQKVEEVKPYYTEGLIHLSLLFKTKVLHFNEEKLSIDFTLEGYERFKEEFLRTYAMLAKHYMQRKDASEFLSCFCVLKDEVFLPLDKECREFVLYYYKRYEEIGNELDKSGEFEYYKAKSLKHKL
ncbi:hypothetical protein DMB95_01365 [Campylobacter sp. MIT 12-8780]|uniref:invasion protein CiaB n=1 Tax=unclassified Campylobacter TaxID=2593542 RepID=UPI00115E3E33|nr:MULTISPECIES: invasion protein CiaB [unclassified Campylobacter]NDJ26610.1 invasion protein CiaB [Campylobacter sp. MIT 19-121]TQR43172.1 hypothetical protein DMB95_01365 [Campylobacter sp. MIT 12-8780]